MCLNWYLCALWGNTNVVPVVFRFFDGGRGGAGEGGKAGGKSGKNRGKKRLVKIDDNF